MAGSLLGVVLRELSETKSVDAARKLRLGLVVH
jgi:hypothetical protein